MIESSHELSLKTNVVTAPSHHHLPSPAYFWTEFPGEPRAHRSIPPSTWVFPALSRPRTYSSLRYSPTMHMENPIRRAETRKTCSNRRNVASREMQRAKCILACENSRSASTARTVEHGAALCGSVARATEVACALKNSRGGVLPRRT